jgi:hypothetical protein
LLLLYLGEAGGNKVGLCFQMVKGYDCIIECKIALRKFKVIYSGRWQVFDEMAQVIAKIANRSTQERHGCWTMV